MRERFKLFTFISGHGETLVESPHEAHINRWLAETDGEIIEVTQSESDRPNVGHHVSVGIWYLPGDGIDVNRP